MYLSDELRRRGLEETGSYNEDPSRSSHELQSAHKFSGTSRHLKNSDGRPVSKDVPRSRVEARAAGEFEDVNASLDHTEDDASTSSQTRILRTTSLSLAVEKLKPYGEPTPKP